MSNLLVVDWDFWFPNLGEAGTAGDHAVLWDWGHSEQLPILLSPVVWVSRAGGFTASGLDIPDIKEPDSGWGSFWNRFTFADDTEFTFADSNAYAGTLTPIDGTEWFERVLLFDAHHDSGYRINSMTEFENQDGFSCEDWMLVHQQNGTTDLEIRYPQWHPDGPMATLPEGVVTRQVVDDGAQVAGVFDSVFVCRSGTWVPPWCDQEFLAFLHACPLDGMQVDDIPLDRGYTMTDALHQASQLSDLFTPTRP